MPLTTLQEFPEVRLGHVGSLFVSVWYSELTVRAVDALEKHHRALAAKYGKITQISVVVGAQSNPTPEMRDRLKEGAVELQQQRRANIVVVQTRGVAAIITRTFLAALSLMSSENMKVFKTLEEAAEMAQQLPEQDAELKSQLSLAADLTTFVNLPRPT